MTEQSFGRGYVPIRPLPDDVQESIAPAIRRWYDDLEARIRREEAQGRSVAGHSWTTRDYGDPDVRTQRTGRTREGPR
jgi:hypothetical protein